MTGAIRLALGVMPAQFTRKTRSQPREQGGKHGAETAITALYRLATSHRCTSDAKSRARAAREPVAFGLDGCPIDEYDVVLRANSSTTRKKDLVGDGNIKLAGDECGGVEEG